MSTYRRGRIWWISYAGLHGELERESTGQNDARVAERMLRERRKQVADGTWQPRDAGTPQRPTIAQYAERWIARQHERKLSTADDIEQRMRDHVLPELGSVLLDSLRPRRVIEFVEHLRRGKLSPRSIHHVYDTLRGLCRDAQIDELVIASPCVLPPGTLPAKRDADPTWRSTAIYTRPELEQLLSDDRIPFDRRMMAALEGLGAMRFGEAAGRRWRDYDPVATPLGRLVVGTQYDDQQLKTADAGIQCREVPVHPLLASMLAEWRLEGFPALFGRPPTADDLIVPSREGRVRSVRHGHRKLNEDLERIGLRPRRQHDLRRTMITLARSDGARGEVLRTVTHGAPNGVFDLYTTWPWATLCEAVACLKVGRLGRAPVGQVHIPVHSGRPRGAEGRENRRGKSGVDGTRTRGTGSG